MPHHPHTRLTPRDNHRLGKQPSPFPFHGQVNSVEAGLTVYLEIIVD
jgi:hypothetical protein